jgi:guanosine-3',5'-bis(diphosphate) 3'-pyrophosphohydrolase
VVLRQFELSEKVRSYDPSANISMIDQAYVFAMKVHGNQKRESGDPYFHHPVEVAGILADMHLDSATIVTALLHDTVEDTLATLSDIEEIFGVEISRLVDGVTKLSKIELQSNDTKQAENFRKLVLAMSNDIRVLLVKLADRLHNMRTLHFVKSEDKRRRIAKETIEIYAPLAERIGMQHMKDELEDLAFKNLHKDSYDTIMERLSFLMHDDNKLIVKEIIEELHKILKKNDVESNISGRVKRPYSIWRKMCRQDVSIEQLSDIMAFRIIVDSVSECYQALGVIHSGYKVMPGRFKDYISTPKPNNYKSLHTTVFGPRKQKIEVQIRTKDMDAVAEYGVAAHWQYKQSSDGFGVGAGSDKKDSENLTYRWIKSLLDILDNTSNPEEFLENTKLEMFHDQVFVFTPNGDLISLPNGSTPVDFAYAILSAVGDKGCGQK